VVFSERAQVGFHFMRQSFGLAQADHSRYSLQRVKTAKQFIRQRTIYSRLAHESFKREQVAAQRRHMLFALGEIVVEKLREKIIIGFVFSYGQGFLLTFTCSTIRQRALRARWEEMAW